MRSQWKISLVCLFVLSLFPAKAGFLDTLSVKQMQEDIKYCFSNLKEIHPDLYARYTETQFDSLRLSMEEECSQEMDLLRFKYVLARVHGFMDEHTHIVDNLMAGLRLGVIPWMDFQAGGIYMQGEKVNSINNISAFKIAKDLDTLVSWAYQSSDRERQKNDLFAYYMLAYHRIISPYYFHMISPETLIEEDILVNFLSQGRVTPSAYHPEYHSRDVAYRLFPEEKIGVFYYNTSYIYQFSGEEDLFLKHSLDSLTTEFFKEAERLKLEYVFIDISQNGGGSDLAHNYLNRYLKSVTYETEANIKITPKGKELLIAQSEQLGSQIYKKAIKKLFKKQAGFSKGKKNILKTRGNRKGFEGQVFLIAGTQTFSAAYDFAYDFKRGKKGIIIGETLGQIAPYPGNVIVFTLPHSRLEWQCPTTYSLMKPLWTNTEGYLEPEIPYPLDHPLELEDFKKIIQQSKENESVQRVFIRNK